MNCFHAKLIPMIREKALVAYKNKPALVTGTGDKINILVTDEAGSSGGKAKSRELRVREKDVEFIHPGPVTDPANLEEGLPAADVRGAWELLSGGGEVSLKELAELAWGAYTPRTAWAAYSLLLDGLYFTGNAGAPRCRLSAEVEAEEKKREAKRLEGRERDAFLLRLKNRELKLPGDERFLQDVEALAFGRTEKSRAMKDLGLTESPEDAHKLLLETGFWTPFVNPHPGRFGLQTASAKIVLPPPAGERRNLTHLAAFAIDSPWSSDPDDAVSIENDPPALYVHVSDPASSIRPDSPAEKEARDRGATLYLPEGVSRMLAPQALSVFALGLQETSPALTFKMILDENGAVLDTEIFPSTVKVTRLTYEEADRAAAAAPRESALRDLFRLGERNLERRLDMGAVNIELPETHISVTGETVSIEPIAAFKAAGMVRECMLIAGEGAAQWAIKNNVPFPFVAQEAGDIPGNILPGMAGAYQLRRCMRPRSLSVKAGIHWGLGLDAYTQVTSPLRRYTDLLAHLQIHAFIHGEKPLSADEVLLRLGAGEAAASSVNQAERASRVHWTMVYLSLKKNSVWDAVVLEKKGPRWVLMIPGLALETQLALRGNIDVNDEIKLTLKSVNIPKGEAVFES
jgi:exoribonuclease-2